MGRVARAALLGLMLGLGAGALLLGVLAAGHLRARCEGLSTQECALEAELGAQLGRLQGVGMARSRR